MRNAFCNAMLEAATADPALVFLTGDLGYRALEPLRDRLGPRFVNAGVAEQNMVSTAAGLARGGMRPWCYSIAPFIYARPFEQVRNDVCLHDLPVRLIGNGGGYGYGVMGATHHALEDYGTLLTLQHMHAMIPAFDADVAPIISRLLNFPHPAYLRLGLSEEPKGFGVPPYAPWRKLVPGRGATLLGIGPLVGKLLAPALAIDEATRPSIWVLTELPLGEIPTEFLADVRRSGRLCVAEEHVAHGGAGQAVASRLLEMGGAPRHFTHRAAAGYPTGLYGSQSFHRHESGLNAAALLAELTSERESGKSH